MPAIRANPASTRLLAWVWGWVLALVLVLVLTGCSQAPVTVGFLGGLTGSAADLGVGGRDGALLAVEQANARGGVGGRAVNLRVFDDGQQPERLASIWPSIESAGLSAMVGPMTSSVAAHWLPLANQAQLLTVSPTVTSSRFSGVDDHFFRVISSTREYASLTARHHLAAGQWRRYALVLDASNQAYTFSWAEHFEAAVRTYGGEVVATVAYPRDAAAALDGALEQALAASPEALMVVANATDTARLAQLLRQRGITLPLLGAEWAATPQLLLAGGRAVEGMLLAQYMDRESKVPRYVAFDAEFRRRYGRAPGFVEVAAYDAMQVVLAGLAQQQRDESLKHTLLRLRRFQGVQQDIVFDGYGDSQRALAMTRVSNGRFVVVP
jgi:branched-chain amino acid transport system substrate-binding protein